MLIYLIPKQKPNLFAIYETVVSTLETFKSLLDRTRLCQCGIMIEDDTRLEELVLSQISEQCVDEIEQTNITKNQSQKYCDKMKLIVARTNIIKPRRVILKFGCARHVFERPFFCDRYSAYHRINHYKTTIVSRDV